MGMREDNLERKFNAYFILVALQVVSFVVFWGLKIFYFVLLFFAAFAAVVTWSYPHSQDWKVYLLIVSPFPLAVVIWWLSGWHYWIMYREVVEAPPGPAGDQNGT